MPNIKYTIYYTECCALCENFKASMGGSYNSVKGICPVNSVYVWSHEYCDNFQLAEEMKEEFYIEEK